MKYEVLKNMYLSFFTSQGLNRLPVPAGSVLHLVNGDLYYNGKPCVDNVTSLLYNDYIVQIC